MADNYLVVAALAAVVFGLILWLVYRNRNEGPRAAATAGRCAGRARVPGCLQHDKSGRQRGHDREVDASPGMRSLRSDASRSGGMATG
jgi:hypothetical protein